MLELNQQEGLLTFSYFMFDENIPSTKKTKMGYKLKPKMTFLFVNRAVAEHLSRELTYKLKTDDVFLTVGANHAIEVLLKVLAHPGANILFPIPNYSLYEAHTMFSPLEVRHFHLLPENGWEVDLDGVKALADDKTVAIVLINPGNPCGNVFTFEHMQKVSFLLVIASFINNFFKQNIYS